MFVCLHVYKHIHVPAYVSSRRPDFLTCREVNGPVDDRMLFCGTDKPRLESELTWVQPKHSNSPPKGVLFIILGPCYSLIRGTVSVSGLKPRVIHESSVIISSTQGNRHLLETQKAT